MQHPENEFSPLLIDQQIEHPATSLPPGEAHLIRDLQAMYDQENCAAIDRVWTRLARQPRSQYDLPQWRQNPASVSPTKRGADVYPVQRKQKPRQASAFVQRLSLLAALLVVTLLVGSLALVLTLSRGSTATGTSIEPASGWGKIMHVQTMPDFGFNGLAWSPDSKRVAASNRATTTNIVRIWDANTGQHLVKIPMHEFVNTISWSPDSQQVAIATEQSITIVDGQSGHVIRTLPFAPQSFTPEETGVEPLSSRFPGSGGPGLRDISWSPDGSQIAASGGGSVLVWTLQTGVLFQLPVQGNNGVEGLSWSSDGKYIAVDTYQLTGTDPLSQCGVVVWKVATRQIVLQKNTGSLPDVNMVVAWQPGTRNLAQIGVVKSGGGYKTAILIFDGVTGKTLQKLVVPVSDVLTWSPDGKYLAYTSPSPADLEKGNAAHILNASNWSTVYTYTDSKNIINELAWSPDGHSIATGETVTENNNASMGVVKVWASLD